MNLLTTRGPLHILGTEWFFELPDSSSTESIVEELFLILEEFDFTYSRFLPDSEISTLNQTGQLKNPSAEMQEILQRGVWLYKASNGYFNFLTGHIQVSRGYDADLSFIETTLKETELYPNPEIDITISSSEITLRKGAVDLGGFGKGYAIDKLSWYLKNTCKLPVFVINGGGDIYVHNTTSQALPFYVEHPFQTGTYTHQIPNLQNALAVSGTQKRTWKTKNTNQEYSHLISTQSETLPGSAVTASTAWLADAYATIFSLAHNNIPKLPTPYPPYLLMYQDNTFRQHPEFPATVLS